MGGYGPRGERPRRRGGGRSEIITIQVVTAPGAGEIVAPRDCFLELFLRGGGASGSVAFNNSRGGGGGGGARHSVRLLKNQLVKYFVGPGGPSNGAEGTIGNNGLDSTVLLPNGSIIVAGGGRGDGAGGLSYGAIENRAGASSGPVNSAGGDAASFSDVGPIDFFAGGEGGAFGLTGFRGASPGGGSGGCPPGGNGTSLQGADGSLVYVLSKASP